ncbi:hypothetical protein BH10PSE6_BH10PSE6_26830 [soil metagenome]
MRNHSRRHAVNVAADHAKVRDALPPGYRYTLSNTPRAWEAKPQALNHSDPHHLKTAG